MNPVVWWFEMGIVTIMLIVCKVRAGDSDVFVDPTKAKHPFDPDYNMHMLKIFMSAILLWPLILLVLFAQEMVRKK